MPAVLTSSSTMECAHRGRLVVSASHPEFTVDGSPALVAKDLLNGKIVGCTLSPGPCTQIMAITAGLSTKLTVGGEPVVLATAQGTTNSGGWRVTDVAQTKLETS